MRSYITKPTSITRSEIEAGEFIFSSARYSQIQVNSNYKYLLDVVDISKQSLGIANAKQYFNYVEIGSINTNTGYVEPKYIKSINISTDSVSVLQKDDILISTVRTYLGGIGIINSNKKDIVASKALIVLRKLKENIDRYYLFIWNFKK